MCRVTLAAEPFRVELILLKETHGVDLWQQYHSEIFKWNDYKHFDMQNGNSMHLAYKYQSDVCACMLLLLGNMNYFVT